MSVPGQQALACGFPSPQGTLCGFLPGHAPGRHSWEPLVPPPGDGLRAIAREVAREEIAMTTWVLTGDDIAQVREIAREELRSAPSGLRGSGQVKGWPLDAREEEAVRAIARVVARAELAGGGKPAREAPAAAAPPAGASREPEALAARVLASDGQDRPAGERMAIDELAAQLRASSGQGSPQWQVLAGEEKGRWRRLAVLARQLQEEISFHYQQLNVARGESARLRQQVTALEHRLGKATRLLDDPDTAASQRKRADELDARLKEARQELASAKEEVTTAVRELRELRSASERQLHEAVLRADSAEKASWASAPPHAQRDMSNARAAQAVAENRQRALEREKEEQSQALEGAEQENARLRNELSFSRQASAALRERVACLEEQEQAMARLRGELQALQAAQLALKGRAGALEAANARLSRDVASAEAKARFTDAPRNQLLRELGSLVYGQETATSLRGRVPAIFAELGSLDAGPLAGPVQADDDEEHAGGNQG